MISFPIILLRLTLALALGGVIGLEREFHEHRAGMRTNALVSLGSALFTLVSAYGFLEFLTLSHVQVDPTRVASYIVAGIGFLGAGAIGTHKEGARGLTTAAAIWTVAAIGMACGVGFYREAIAATVLTLIVLRLLRFIEWRLIPNQMHITMQIRLEPGHVHRGLMRQIYDLCVKQRLTVETIHTQPDANGDVLEINCRQTDVTAALHALEELREIKGVRDGHLDLRDLDTFKRKMNFEEL